MNRRVIPTWLPLAILAGTLLFLYAPILFGDRYLFWGLPTLQFFPWRTFAFGELSAGRLPFLNTNNGAGAPLIANYQTAVFYPPNWLHMVLPSARVMGLLAVGHVFWSGLGMWAFMGRLEAVRLGRGISTLSFALAGYGIARMGSFPTANAIAWMPWLFWAILRLIERRTALNIGLLSVTTAMLLLVGHAQTAFYTLLASGGFTLWAARWMIGPATVRTRLNALVAVGSGVLLGAGIAATQLLLTAELLAQSQRSGGVDFARLTNLSFAPLRSLVFLTPDFFGSPVDGSYLTPGKGSYFEDAVYIGFLPLIAAVAGLLGGWQQRKFLGHWKTFRSVPFWFVMGLAGFILGLGRNTALYRILYDYVPTFDAFREPVRWMILPVFALCVLAGIGVQNWPRGPRIVFWSRLAGAAGGGFAVIALISSRVMQSDQQALEVLSTALIVMGCWIAGSALLTLIQPDDTRSYPPVRWQLAVLLFVAADLGWAAHRLNPTVPGRYYRPATFTEPRGRLYWFEDYLELVMYGDPDAEEPEIEPYFDVADYRNAVDHSAELRNSLLPNLNMLDDVPLFNNFDPLLPEYYARYVEIIEEQGTQSDRLLRAAGVGQVYGNIQPEGWARIDLDHPSFLAPQTPPLAWLVAEAVWSETDEAVEANLIDDTWDPTETVILKSERPDGSSEPLRNIRFFETLEDSSSEKRYRVATDGGGFLVLATAWYPGWTVKIDGETQPLYRANLAFMAVELPPGGGEVVFRYRPTIGLAGILLSLAALFLTLGLIAVGLVREFELPDRPLSLNKLHFRPGP